MTSFGHRIIDIETTAITDAAAYLEPATAPANYKDEAKIAAYIVEAQNAELRKCALDPDLARIVAIGIADPATNEQHVIIIKDEHEEAAALESLWSELAGQVTVIGYNVISFDIPVLLRRSQYLKVKAPAIQIDKYRHPTVIDLMQVLSFNGAQKYRGLAFYLWRFGIPHDDTVSGKDIAGLVAAGDWEAVAAHCRADVLATVALAKRLGVVAA